MGRKPKRERTTRREVERKLARLAEARERVFVREPGGSPDHPLDLESASVVEVRARAIRCPRCEGEHSVRSHEARSQGGERLREVQVECQGCRARRSLWFRLPVLN